MATAQAGDDRHHVRGAIFRVHLRQHAGQQAIAAHHEEHAGLREHHHEDDGRQCETGRQAEHVAHAGMADGAQHVGERFVGADDRQRGFGEGLALGPPVPASRAAGLRRSGRTPAARHSCRSRLHPPACRTRCRWQGWQSARSGMLRCGFLVSSAAVDTASKPTKAKKMMEAAPMAPVAPKGRKGSNLSAVAAGTRQEDERRQRHHLHGDKHGVDRGAFLGAEHQQPGGPRAQ